MMREIDFITQTSFLDIVPRPEQVIEKPYTSTVQDFFDEAIWSAMWQIGKIYVPRFSEENHMNFENAAIWLEKNANKESIPEENIPEYVDNSVHRLDY